MSKTVKKKPRRVVGEKRRLNLKLDGDLAEWVFDFAKRHDTSVTQLIIDFFKDMRVRELSRMAQDAEQI